MAKIVFVPAHQPGTRVICITARPLAKFFLAEGRVCGRSPPRQTLGTQARRAFATELHFNGVRAAHADQTH